MVQLNHKSKVATDLVERATDIVKRARYQATALELARMGLPHQTVYSLQHQEQTSHGMTNLRRLLFGQLRITITS